MEKSKLRKIERKLMSAKLGLLSSYPFYALLLTHIKFIPNYTCKSITCVDNDIIYLPEFVEGLDNDELQFVLMHLIMHLALGHPFRKQENYVAELYDLACDIVVNSNIINSMWQTQNTKAPLKIFPGGNHLILQSSFPHIEYIPYLTPDNKDGFYFTADEVYKMLKEQKAVVEHAFEQKNEEGRAEAEAEKEDKKTKAKSKSPKKDEDYDPDCDDELQQLLNSLKKQTEQRRENFEKSKCEEQSKTEEKKQESFDDHTYWMGESENELIPPSEKWNQRCMDLTQIVDCGGVGSYGHFPAGVKRKIDDIKNPLLDWRQVLNDFVQEEICDYSFSPPDKRMQDSPFFLPDFNETEAVVKKILFAIDCSGSMGDDMITQCYSEIYHAILQFGGKLEGYVGFFDSKFYNPKPFASIEEFSATEPSGGGGTEIEPVFDYVHTEMADDPPVSIVILTDGYVNIPNEEVAKDIPVLWIINNNEITPTWGKVVRMIDN